MRCVFSCLVQNSPGVLAKVSGLFAGRGYNIDSLAVGETEDPRLSRMTVVSRGEQTVLEQIRKQLEKLVPVVKVVDLTEIGHVERELILVKVHAPPQSRSEVLQLVEIFRARIADVSARDLMIEISGRSAKLETFLDLVRPYGIREVARTGAIVMARGTGMAGEREDARAGRRPGKGAGKGK